MNAIEALRHNNVSHFDTKRTFEVIYQNNVDLRQLTSGRAIKLYRSAKNEIFGMVGINLPEFITERKQARVAVNIRPALQEVIARMAEQAAEKYPYALQTDNFDFCLHAPLLVGEKNALELMEGNNWQLHPGMQYTIRPISQKATEIIVNHGRIGASFNNPQHLVGFFLGSSRFSFAVDLEAETYKLGKSEVYTAQDLFEAMGKNPKYMECGENPHLPTVKGRLLQLADTMNGYKENTVTPEMVGDILQYYQNFKSHEQPIIVADEEEGW